MQIGSYQVLFELGRGGMGTVYLARIVFAGGIERLVAIKRAHPRLMENAEATERFVNEARLTAHVHHANVVGIHQTGTDEDGHYLVFDYVEGESLANICDRIPQPDTMPPAIAVRILLDALSGLHAAHETVDSEGKPLGMLHRDVSAENLLVGADGVTRLMDFGIAKSTLSSVVTQEGIVHGKLIYLSPEYLRRAPMGRPLDVYAMGITLWIALAGTLPWREKLGPEVISAILEEGMPALSSTGIEIDPVLANIVACACERDPSKRFQTARQMLDALEQYARSSGAMASHVEVAEYVHKIVGKGFAARREKIKARRAELERQGQGANMAAELQLLATDRQPMAMTEREPSKPGAYPPGPPGFNAIPYHTAANVTEVFTQPKPDAKRHWVVYAGVMVLGLVLGYGVFTVGLGNGGPIKPASASVAKPHEEFTGTAQRTSDAKTSTPPTPAVAEPRSEAVETMRIDGEDGEKAGESAAKSAAPAAKKRAKQPLISTKNPYR